MSRGMLRSQSGMLWSVKLLSCVFHPLVPSFHDMWRNLSTEARQEGCLKKHYAMHERAEGVVHSLEKMETLIQVQVFAAYLGLS